jgi:hypothetical protein
MIYIRTNMTTASTAWIIDITQTESHAKSQTRKERKREIETFPSNRSLQKNRYCCNAYEYERKRSES